PAKAGDDDLRLSQFGVRKILERVIEDIRRIGDPGAAVANGDAGGDIEAFDDGGYLVKLTVPLGAFENLDAILARLGSAARIFDRLCDPDAAALVETHRHRIDNVRLGGDQLDAETGRHLHLLERLLGREGRAGRGTLAVWDRVLVGLLVLGGCVVL